MYLRVGLIVKGRASIGLDQLGGKCFEGCSEVLMYLFSLHVPWSCYHFDIHCIFDIYIYIYFFTFVSRVLFLFYLYTHVSSCIQLFYVSHLMP